MIFAVVAIVASTGINDRDLRELLYIISVLYIVLLIIIFFWFDRGRDNQHSFRSFLLRFGCRHMMFEPFALLLFVIFYYSFTLSVYLGRTNWVSTSNFSLIRKNEIYFLLVISIYLGRANWVSNCNFSLTIIVVYVPYVVFYDYHLLQILAKIH